MKRNVSFSSWKDIEDDAIIATEIIVWICFILLLIVFGFNAYQLWEYRTEKILDKRIAQQKGQSYQGQRMDSKSATAKGGAREVQMANF